MNTNIRTAEAINADITAINAHIDAVNQQAEATGTTVSPSDLRQGELNLLTLELRAANAIEKFASAKRVADAAERVANVGVGDAVTFVHGRAATKRIESGTVLAAADGKFNVMVGEGFESRTVLVGADALLLDAEDVAAAERDIAEAKAKADAKAEGQGE